MIKFLATVTEIGPMVEEFINAGILVFFGDNAPPELVEFSIIHDGKKLKENVEPNDAIFIDDQDYKILAVGEIANTNLRNLGHLIMKFNGKTKVELPGDVCVESKPIPQIKVGTTIKIQGK